MILELQIKSDFPLVLYCPVDTASSYNFELKE